MESLVTTVKKQMSISKKRLPSTKSGTSVPDESNEKGKSRRLNARQKGHQFERALRLRLLKFFPKCLTSRLASKLTDDAGIDFVRTRPFAIQAKAVEGTVDYWKLIPAMKINDPDEDVNSFHVVVHKKNNKGTVVVMSLEDFESILELII
tara:strand:- start:12763 stop:13212 length:450 start_codon:yes stop_codon:yes gene_type:complete